MKVITYLESLSDLDLILENKITDIILGTKNLSRFGKLTIDQFHQIASIAKSNNLNVHLDWDILITESLFSEKINEFNKIDLSLIKSVRAQDPGVIEYLLRETNLPLSLILETGNHNLEGILSWCDYLKDRLDRVLLSIELPQERLRHYAKKLKQREIKWEFLGLGRILLFYTPRSLLAPVLFDHDDDKTQKIISEDFLELMGSSEESPHKGFPVIENQHGTFMFHIKDHYLMENISDLEDIGLDYIRIDLRFKKDMKLLNMITDCIASFSKEKANRIKELYPADVIRGFFNVNKTDTLFIKLKNQRLQRKDENYVGEIFEVQKSKYIVFMNRNPLIKVRRGDRLKFINPEGKIISSQIHKLQNSKMMDVEEIGYEELGVMNFIGGAVAKTQIYFDPSPL